MLALLTGCYGTHTLYSVEIRLSEESPHNAEYNLSLVRVEEDGRATLKWHDEVFSAAPGETGRFTLVSSDPQTQTVTLANMVCRWTPW